MAKKQYIATVGFDVEEGRFEAGEVVTGVKASTIEQLLADGDIENGDSKD